MTWTAPTDQAETKTPEAYRSDRRPVTKSVADVLSESHRRMLFEESGISPEVAAERGYRTITRSSEIPAEFEKRYQRKPGLLIPVNSPSGKSGNRLRAHRPRLDKKGKPIKYEQPEGAPNVIDVHPSNHKALKNVAEPLWITEGEKKADSLTSRGLCAVALFGVWGWCVPGTHGKELLPCWYHVALDGRRVYVVFDSDLMVKEGVQMALERLVRALEARGADVRVVYLPGPEKGVDDYLVAGGTVAELRALARRFETEDLGRIRLSRDEKLRALVDDLRAGWWIEGWKGRGSKADRDIALKLIEAATRSGKPHRDGIRVKVSWGVLKVEAKVSPRTLSKAVARLEDRGFLHRDNEGRKGREAGAFVLRANVNQKGGTAGKEAQELRGYDPCGIHSRALPTVPRLWASRPKWKPTKKMIYQHRMGVRTWLPEPHERIERLGKTRGAALDFLEAAGRLMTKQEMADALHCRARDLVRRKKPGSKGRDGVLVMLIDTGIIECEGDVFRLAAEWCEKLNVARRDGGEIENDERAETHRKRKSEDYREWLAGKAPASKPSAAGLAAIERSAAKRAEHLAEQERRRMEPDTAELERRRFVKRFVHDKLREFGRVGLGSIRLELLQDLLREKGGTSAYALPAAKSLGCTVEERPEYPGEVFILTPALWRAA